MTSSRSSGASRTVVVTGAAGGMGLATVALLAERGWQVLACDREGSTPPTGATGWLACDLRARELEDRLHEALAGMAPLGGLVNMAGASIGAPVETLGDADWDASFAINVTPAMRLTRALAGRLRAAGGGSIVNVGSPVGLVGARKASYAASKAALHGLTMSCARTLGPDGIRVNLLLPGPTITGMTADWSEERRNAIAAGSFLRRLCRPEEVASAVAFLLGVDSSYMTGTVLDLTAGTLWGH